MRKNYGDKPKRVSRPKSSSAPKPRSLEQIARDMNVHPSQNRRKKS